MRCWSKVVLLLPLLAGGCVTHKLWSESLLDSWNEPAASPNLRLFRDERRNKLLVVYDEFSERHDATRTRAFFLQPDQKPPSPSTRPHFVDVKLAEGLQPVPLLATVPTDAADLFFAVEGTNRASFTIFSGGQPMDPHTLPMYDDGWGKIERIAWTPFAVTADLTIIGGCLGYMWIYWGGPGIER